jgi:eukaryotic-like serine/threonine-protein kinase
MESPLPGLRPSTDPVARALVRARVVGALFDRAADPVEIGRFQLLERVGRGGMGTVYSAYDPDLDRRVALKLVSTADGASRARLLAEARALARLSHPHVVPVHDVELVDDWVCIVMEFVRGQTLRAYCADAGRPERDIVRVYRQAAEGLQAAHRAGLLHGDFKPDNAIVGADGRVRVVDFGLARPVSEVVPTSAEQVEVSPRPGGTPGYMAPELQAATGAVAAAVDQYSFCASLKEALGGQAPRWLLPALERGLATEPADRFPSMAELLRELARDPSAIRTRRRVTAALAIGTAALAVGAFVTGRRLPGDEGGLCEQSAEKIAGVWNHATAARVRAALDGGGAYGAVLRPRLLARIDHYAEQWRRSRRSACAAHRRGEQSSALFDRRMACLDNGHQALGALIDLLARQGAALPDAVMAARALPPVERCDDAEALLAGTRPPPPGRSAEVARLDGELARAGVLLAAGRAEAARAAADPVVAGARRTGYTPLLARALLTRGHAEMRLEPRQRAVPTLREATATALEAGDDLLAVEAYARRLWAEGTSAGVRDHQGTFDGLAVIEALADRHPAGAFVRALLHSNVAGVQKTAGRSEQAASSLQRALIAAQQVPPPRPVELVNIQTLLALNLTDAARRAELLTEVVAQRTATLGPEHPLTLDARIRAAVLAEDPARATQALPSLCASYRRLHPSYGTRIADCLFEVGWLAHDRGDHDQTTRSLAAAASIEGLEPGYAGLIRGYLLLARAQPAAARQAFRGALARLAAVDRAPWWTRFQAGDAHLGRGLALRAGGDRVGARTAFAAAEALLAAVAREQPLAPIHRRLARARAERARR